MLLLNVSALRLAAAERDTREYSEKYVLSEETVAGKLQANLFHAHVGFFFFFFLKGCVLFLCARFVRRRHLNAPSIRDLRSKFVR